MLSSIKPSSALRSRWAAVGAAIAVTVGSGGILTTSASVGSGERAVFVPITPCRVMDTRRAPDNVGSRSTPIGTNETHTIPVRGVNGNCTIPADAVGLVMNVAAINPTAASFLTVFPADAPRPLAANLNWAAGQLPLSNSVTADVSSDGKVSFYNLAGTVDIAADIVGYYADHNHDDAYYTKAQTYSKAEIAGNSVVGRMTIAQIATVAWHQDPARTATFPAPAGATGLWAGAFDGTSIWTVNYLSSNVTRFDRVTGAGENFALPVPASHPQDIVFDGVHLWTANSDSDNVTRIDPATGAGQNFPLPGGAASPVGLLFDGTYIWTANEDSANLTRIDPVTGVGQNFPLAVGASGPFKLAFDGANVWSVNTGTGNVTRVVAATGAAQNFALPGATGPAGIAFDGTYIWIASINSGNVSRITTTTGTSVTFPLSGFAAPTGLAFDGTSMWTADYNISALSRIDVSSGTAVNVALPTGATAPYEVVFDGVDIWSINDGSNSVTRMLP